MMADKISIKTRAFIASLYSLKRVSDTITTRPCSVRTNVDRIYTYSLGSVSNCVLAGALWTQLVGCIVGYANMLALITSKIAPNKLTLTRS